MHLQSNLNLLYLILSIISIILPRLNIKPLFSASCKYTLQPLQYCRPTVLYLYSSVARVANSCCTCMYVSPAWNISHQSKAGPHNNHTLRSPTALLQLHLICSTTVCKVHYSNDYLQSRTSIIVRVSPELRDHRIPMQFAPPQSFATTFNLEHPIMFAPLPSFMITAFQCSSHLSRAS